MISPRHKRRFSRLVRTVQWFIDCLGDPVFVIGPDATVEIANRAAQTLLLISPGKSVSALSLGWLNSLYESVKLNHRAVEAHGFDDALQLFDRGKERVFLPRAMPMIGSIDDLIGVTVILMDITDLHQIDELKDTLLLTATHELRTPLTGIRMALSLLNGDGLGSVSAKQKMLIQTASQDSDRLNRTIENLLDMSRLEAGGAQLQFESVEPGELVAAAVDPLRQGFVEKKIALEVSVADPINPVKADRAAIISVLTNLLSNAMKFTPPDGKVRLTADGFENKVRFSVTDTGPGIPEEFRSRIFEKFFRVPQSNGPLGAGLGLAIAKEIIEAHGGGLTFDNPPNGGTTFSFSISPFCPA